MIVKTPQDQSILAARRWLLQTALRPDPLPYSIEEEYPIVLSPKEHRFSFCAVTPKDDIIAHANLWPRTLTSQDHQESFQVGLVGNVATHPNYRGGGYMKTLFGHLAEYSQSMGLEALILWSDLIEFYQKLGFQSFGREYRFAFSPESMKNFPTSGGHFRHRSPEDFDEAILLQAMQLRNPTNFSVSRSPEEFKTLLQTPDLNFFYEYSAGAVTSYFIVGKGFDMVNVIHEWGALNPNTLLRAVSKLLVATNWPEVLVLGPTSISEPFRCQLEAYAVRTDVYPIALAQILKPDNPKILEVLEQSFFWGLDSI